MAKKTAQLTRIIWRSLLGLTGFLLCFGIYSSIRIYDIAELQNSIDRPLEIELNLTKSRGDRPAFLPASVDDLFYDAAAWFSKFRVKRGAPPWHSASMVYHERLRAPFRGRIREMTIYQADRYRENFGGAIAEFQSLEKLTIHVHYYPSGQIEADLIHAFKGIASLERLTEFAIDLADPGIEVLAPLRECPCLQKLEFGEGQPDFTPKELADVLREIETLEQFKIAYPPSPEWLEQLQDLLPDLKVVGK